VEWPAKRNYVGLVAVGVQEQAEDILVSPLLRKCLTLNYILPQSLSPLQNSGPCNSFHCLGHSKNVYDDDDDAKSMIFKMKTLKTEFQDVGRPGLTPRQSQPCSDHFTATFSRL